MTRMANFKALDPRAVLPTYAYPGDAGMDFAVVGDHTLAPGESRDLPSGIAVEFPPGYWGRITGRSSTLRKLGVFINEGVIDSGYRGELLTYVTNRNATPVQIAHGTRLAQLIVSEVIQTETRFVAELAPSPRGERGFGSTGVDGKPVAPVVNAMAADKRAGDGRFELYLGGPIDLAEEGDYHSWRHRPLWDGIDAYCPICINRGDGDTARIMRRNTEALYSSPVAVFDLRMIHHSIGTPVEIEQYITRRDADAANSVAVLVHPFSEAKRGIFVRWWESRGARVVATFEDAARLASECLGGMPAVP